MMTRPSTVLGLALLAALSAAGGQAAEKESAKRDPAVESAAIAVLTMEDLVRQTESICMKSRPTSTTRYQAAVDAWRARNGTMASQARRALDQPVHEMTLGTVQEAIKARNERTLSPVNAASATARTTWCDRSMVELTAGKLDVFLKPELSGPLSRLDAGDVTERTPRGGAKHAKR